MKVSMLYKYCFGINITSKFVHYMQNVHVYLYLIQLCTFNISKYDQSVTDGGIRTQLRTYNPKL